MREKAEIRSAMRERLQRLSAKDRAMESRVLCKELRKELGGPPQHIAGFLPLSDEPDLRPLLAELLTEGWTLSLPAMEKNALVFRTVRDVSETVPGTFGIDEPHPSAPRTDLASLNIVLVPGRAFTRSGERMGRGNGGYDHWIGRQRNEHPHTRYIGVCFECQLLMHIPTEPHDQKMDTVVTSRGVVSG